MKKEDIYQMVWYLDTDNIFKREKRKKFEKSNRFELREFLFNSKYKFKKNKVSNIYTKN